MVRAGASQSMLFPFLSRRREPRVSVREMLTAQCISPDGPKILAVRDLGFRGFAIETPSTVPPRTRARFSFQSADVAWFEADAVCVHCFRLGGAEERWVSGWEFPEQAGLDARIELLLDEAVGVINLE